jgi:hypothetical protein
MKFLVKFEPTNINENHRAMSKLYGATVSIDLTEETASVKGIETLLPDIFKAYIEEIISVKIDGKTYDSNTTFTEAVAKGGFIILKVKMPAAHKSTP